MLNEGATQEEGRKQQDAAAAAHVSNNVDAPIRQKHLLLAETDGHSLDRSDTRAERLLLLLLLLLPPYFSFTSCLVISVIFNQKRGGKAEGRGVA